MTKFEYVMKKYENMPSGPEKDRLGRSIDIQLQVCTVLVLTTITLFIGYLGWAILN